VAALKGIDLTLSPGEQVAIVGPSGAGKSTLLKLVNGLVTPTRGRALLGGEDLSLLPPQRLSKWRSKVGYIPQDFGLVPNVRVHRNVISGRIGGESFFGTVRSAIRPPRESLERIHEILERLGIQDHLFRRTDSLSGGEQQRVAIARALFQDPHALLADEPLASVDPARARALLELLQSLATERGLTLLASLHNVDLARSHFPRILGLRDGALRFDKAPEELEQGDFDTLYHIPQGHEQS